MEFKVCAVRASLGRLRLHVFSHGAEATQWAYEITGLEFASTGRVASREEAEKACTKAAAAYLQQRVKEADVALSEARAALGQLTGERL